MIISQDRIVLAVIAFAVFFLIQSKQRKSSERFLNRLRERQKRDFAQFDDPEAGNGGSDAYDLRTTEKEGQHSAEMTPASELAQTDPLEPNATGERETHKDPDHL